MRILALVSLVLILCTLAFPWHLSGGYTHTSTYGDALSPGGLGAISFPVEQKSIVPLMVLLGRSDKNINGAAEFAVGAFLVLLLAYGLLLTCNRLKPCRITMLVVCLIVPVLFVVDSTRVPVSPYVSIVVLLGLLVVECVTTRMKAGQSLPPPPPAQKGST